jgi:hypothetical protein
MGIKDNILRISVLILVIRLIIFALTLASPPDAPPAPAPKAGSVTDDADQPMRARKRSSERIAMAFMRRMDTVCVCEELVS